MTAAAALILSAVGCAVMAAVVWWDQPQRVTPDGQYYLAAASGKKVPVPYARRWLLPWLIGYNPEHWVCVTIAAVVGWGPALTWLLHGWQVPWQQAAWAAVAVAGLPGLFRLSVALPVLVDAPAFLMALLSAAAMRHDLPLTAALLALLAGACKESAPLFAALWAWHPLPLLGFLASNWYCKAAEPDQEWLRHPVKAARAMRAGRWLDWKTMLLPWGIAALAVPLCAVREPTLMLPVLVTLAAAYAQLLMANDDSRLYSWAAPMVLLCAATCVPPAMLPPLVVLSWMNPYRGI